MSSLKNAVPRRAHKERAQPESRKIFGPLEKHKDYVLRARSFQKKQQTLQKLKEKAALKNPDEFNFKMINSRMVDGVHKPLSKPNNYSQDELRLMKTQDVWYILQKIQREKKKIDILSSTLQFTDKQPSNKHIYFAENRKEAKEIESKISKRKREDTSDDFPDDLKRKREASYRVLEGSKARLEQLNKIYEDMTLQKELQKKGKRRKLRQDEIVNPTSRPVYKWRMERKR